MKINSPGNHRINGINGINQWISDKKYITRSHQTHSEADTMIAFY